MGAASPFRQGVKAAIPVWIAFIPVSFALGMGAKAYGLHLGEIVLMSALVYAGPAQFAALEPLASGKPAVQILLTTFLINLRFLVMSAALAPYFGRVKRATLLVCSHLLSASSFILPYTHFRKASRSLAFAERGEERGRSNLRYFVGVGLTNFVAWVFGTGLGYWAALSVPAGFEEGLRFMLPAYFACLLTMELRGWTAVLVGMASFVAAVPGALLSTDWGWLGTALVIGTAGWGIEQWSRRGSR